MRRSTWVGALALSAMLLGCGDSQLPVVDRQPGSDGGSVLGDAGAGADSAAEPDSLPGADGAGSEIDIERARELVKLAIALSGPARLALELLGIVPLFECGEARAEYVERAAEGLEIVSGVLGPLSIGNACLDVDAEARDSATDAVVLDFADGCKLAGSAVAGRLAFVYAGGDKRTEVTADLSDLLVGGEPLGVEVGYGTCGDERRAWVKAGGDSTSDDPPNYNLDLTVAQRKGLPLIGTDTIVLDGTASFEEAGGEHTVTFEQLEFEVGAPLPRSGKLKVQRADGSTVDASFEHGLLHDKASVSIDGGTPVEVPIL